MTPDSGVRGLVLILLSILVYLFVHILTQAIIGMRLKLPVAVVSLGFGPRLFGVRWRGTDWRVSLIPLGAYTNFAGEDGDASALDRLQAAQKAMVGSAGPLSTLLVGTMVLAISHFAGRVEPRFLSQPAVIGWVRPDTAFAHAGLRFGDQVLSVRFDRNPVATRSWRDLVQALYRTSGRHITLSCRRDGINTTIEVPPGPEPLLNVAHRIPPPKLGVFAPDEPVVLTALGWSDSIRSAIVDEIEGTESLVRSILRDTKTNKTVAQDNGYASLVSLRFATGNSALTVMMGMLGLWLALFNLLPMSGFNGGDIAIAVAEASSGRPVSLKAKQRFSQVSFLLILIWFGYAIYGDARQIWKLP
jgi:regulator of sigma E protease